MTNSLARFREAGSFIAGLLIGLSIVVFVFAKMVADPGAGQLSWVFGAPVSLVYAAFRFLAADPRNCIDVP